jgi:hypothetical protein
MRFIPIILYVTAAVLIWRGLKKLLTKINAYAKKNTKGQGTSTP